MAKPNGFRVVSTVTSNIKKFYIDGNTATAVFKGDLVYGTGSSSTNDSYPTAIVMSANNTNNTAYLGPVLACYSSAFVELNYLPASTAGYVEVETDPLALLMVITGSDATALNQGAVMAGFNMNAAAGNTTTGQSGCGLSENAVTTPTAAQFRLIDLYHTDDNAWGSHNIKVVVKAQTHMHLSTPAGI